MKMSRFTGSRHMVTRKTEVITTCQTKLIKRKKEVYSFMSGQNSPSETPLVTITAYRTNMCCLAFPYEATQHKPAVVCKHNFSSFVLSQHGWSQDRDC